MEKLEKTTYKAITLEKYKGQLHCKEYTLRELKPKEVLVKIMCSTIMPADLALLQGSYGSMLPNPPIIPGMEGSGIIVDVGSEIDKKYIGKHCGIIANSSDPEYSGVWAQYCYSKLRSLLVYDKELPFDKIFSSLGNPLTATGFIDTIRKHGAKSVAHSGASSAFGRMFMRLCIKEGIEVVNIVRKQTSADELKELGGKHFINTSVKGWEKELKSKCEELDISILFDCAGGEITGKCLSAIKNGGTLYHFGNLELSRLSGIETSDFIFGHKKMEGWWLTKWMGSVGIEELKKWTNYIKNDFENNDGSLFSTDYKASFKLEEVEKAFESYLSSSGKIVFKPWD